MKKGQKKLVLGLLVLTVVGFGFFSGVFGSIIGAILPGGIVLPPTDSNSETVKLTGVVQLSNGTAVNTATVYIIYDGVTISDATDSSGVFATGNFVPEGKDLIVQIEKTSYHTARFAASVPTGNWADRDTADIGVFVIYYEAQAADTTSSVTDQSQTSISSSYNFTASGTSLKATFQLNVGTAGERAGNDAFTNVRTGYSYTGPMLVVKTTSNLIVVDGADDLVTAGTTRYFIFYTAKVYNDPLVTGDGVLSWQIDIDVQLSSTSNDSLGFYFYQSVRTDHVETANFGTALESITDIDLQA